MTDQNLHEFDPRLLDLHLGHLSADEQAALRARIAADPALARDEAALQQVFAALQRVRTTNPPAHLRDRIRARIADAGPAPRVIRPADELTEAVEERGERIIRLSNLRDLVAVAALVVLAIGVGVPGLMHMRERQQRMGCSWNLAQIGTGMQQYATTFNASLPFAGWSQASSWQPTSDPEVQTVFNRRHVYPLLRRAYVLDPRLFVCTAQRGMPMPKEAIAEHDDFLESRNVTYTYQNMAGVHPSPLRDNPEMPVMADDTPLFEDGLPLFDIRRLPWRDIAQLNSRAHGGAGQNVLTLGGTVKWVTTPEAGVRDDNIWTLTDVTSYTGREGPTATTDSHLLK